MVKLHNQMNGSGRLSHTVAGRASVGVAAVTLQLMEIFKIFTVECAHRLPNAGVAHKCARLHGHSMKIEVHVRGEPDLVQGWVCDFAEVKRAFQPLYEQLDHNYLNDIPGLENPTSEMLAKWVWNRLQPTLPGLDHIVVQETCTAGACYHGR